MALASLFPNEQHLGLMASLESVQAAAVCFVQGIADRKATFELTVRRLPARGNYLVAAGLAQALHFLHRFSFSPEQIRFLRQQPEFAKLPGGWDERLAELRFEGDVWALPEGTVFFPPTPMLRVTAPLFTGLLLEGYLRATLGFQTAAATQASQCVFAAAGRSVVYAGGNAAVAPQADLLAARAGFIGGLSGTTHVEAGRRLGIPLEGAQSSACVLALSDTQDSFRTFAELFGAHAPARIDTGDPLEEVARLLASGQEVTAVRLDCGDLLEASRGVRRLLDQAGRQQVKIVAGGSLDAGAMARLLADGAPIDRFVVPLESGLTAGIETCYHLVELETEFGLTGRVQGMRDELTLPYAKQVYRFTGEGGRYEFDRLVRETELLEGDPLLAAVLKGGEQIEPLPTLADARKHCDHQKQHLPPALLGLGRAEPPYRVDISRHLQREAERLAGLPTEA